MNLLTLGMSVFRGDDLVPGNYPERDAFIARNAPTQFFSNKLGVLRAPTGGAVTHINAAVGGAFDHEMPVQFASVASGPFHLIFLGLGMNSGSIYGVHGRGPNAQFTKEVLRDFIRSRKAAGGLPVLCNTIHPWPEKFDPVRTAGDLIEGIAWPSQSRTLYTHVSFTLDADAATLRTYENGVFDAGPGRFLKAGSLLRVAQDGGGNTGQTLEVLARIDGSTLQLAPGAIRQAGTFRALLQHYAPPAEEILPTPLSKQRQFRDWTGRGIPVDGLESYREWNAILHDLCKEEEIKLVDFEYRGFRWVEANGWASVYASSYGGVPFETYNHPQYAAAKVIYGEMMEQLATAYQAGTMTAGYEVLRGSDM